MIDKLIQEHDIQTMAIYGSRSLLISNSLRTLDIPGSTSTWLVLPSGVRSSDVEQAIRVLKAFEMIFEHGDGVVSVKEQA